MVTFTRNTSVGARPLVDRMRPNLSCATYMDVVGKAMCMRFSPNLLWNGVRGEAQSPTGFETGTIAVVGKQGQKVVLKPDENEIAISCETLSIIRDSKGVEQTKGDFEHTIDGKRSIAVKQDDSTTVDGKSETAVTGSLSLSTDQNGEFKAQINLTLSATAIATLSGAQVKLGGDGASDFLVKGTTFLSALIGLLSSGTDSFGKPIFPAAAAALQPGSMLSNKVSVQ